MLIREYKDNMNLLKQNLSSKFISQRDNIDKECKMAFEREIQLLEQVKESKLAEIKKDNDKKIKAKCDVLNSFYYRILIH